MLKASLSSNQNGNEKITKNFILWFFFSKHLECRTDYETISIFFIVTNNNERRPKYSRQVHKLCHLLSKIWKWNNDFPQWTRNVIPIGLPDRSDLPLLDLNSSTDDFELQVPFLSHLNVSSQPICRNPSLQTNSAFSPGTKMLLLQPGRHFNMAFATGGFGAEQFFSCNESTLGDENSVLGWRHPIISTAKHMITREVVHIKDFILPSEIHTMIIAACLAKYMYTADSHLLLNCVTGS